jgi:hypothetical protein
VRNFRTAWSLVLSHAMNANGHVAVSGVISFHLVMQCVCTLCTWACGWLFVIEWDQICTFTVDIRKISLGNSTLFREFHYTCKTCHVPLVCPCDSPSYFFGVEIGSTLIIVIYVHSKSILGSRGGAVGWDTALQAGRSRVRSPVVSFEFFMEVIFPAALWPWSSLNL